MHDECFEVTQKRLKPTCTCVYLLSEQKAHKQLGRYVGMLPQQNLNFRLSEITSGAFSDTYMYLTTKDI